MVSNTHARTHARTHSHIYTHLWILNNTQHAKLPLTPHQAVEERLRNVSHECVPRGISSPLITTYVFMLGVECEDLRREAVRLPEAQGQRDLQWLHWRNVSLITQNGVPNWGEDSEERSLGAGGESSLVTVKMSVCLSYVNHISSASMLVDTYLVTERTNGIC